MTESFTPWELFILFFSLMLFLGMVKSFLSWIFGISDLIKEIKELNESLNNFLNKDGISKRSKNDNE